jgi:hypothetical protein
VLCLAFVGQAPVFRLRTTASTPSTWPSAVGGLLIVVGFGLDGRLLLDRRRPDACLGRKMIRKGAAEPAAPWPLLPFKDLRHLNRLRPAV